MNMNQIKENEGGAVLKLLVCDTSVEVNGAIFGVCIAINAK